RQAALLSWRQSACSSKSNKSSTNKLARSHSSEGDISGDCAASAVALAADELFDAAVSFVVAHLDGRMLGKIGGGRIEDPADPAIEREFAAADGVDRDAGRVGRVFDRQFNVEFHRHVAKKAAFHPNERNFVVELPRHVIARADVNVLVGQTFAHD